MNESDLSVKIPKLEVNNPDDFPSQLMSYIKNDPTFRELLDSNNYKELYSYVSNSSIVTGQLTHLLYSLGFDPLKELTFVPRNFFMVFTFAGDSTITKYFAIIHSSQICFYT